MDMDTHNMSRGMTGLYIGGGVLVVVGVLMLILVSIGVFGKKETPQTHAQPKKPHTNTVTNSYLLYPDDTYVHHNTSGELVRGNGNQELCDLLYTQQVRAEFGISRVLIMLAPGIHYLEINLGYYTQVVGLGMDRSEVRVVGKIGSENKPDPCTGALNNFFRSISNLTIATTDDRKVYFDASQASPVRQVTVDGELHLSQFEPGCGGDQGSGGYSSGGFMSNCEIFGKLALGTQQQFFIRDSTFDSTDGGAWNLVFMNCKGVEPYIGDEGRGVVRSVFPDSSLPTALGACPMLVVGDDGKLRIHQQQNKKRNKPVFFAGTTTSVAEINTKLASGHDLVLSPGIYEYDGAIVVSEPDTVVLGLGFATIHPKKGEPALTVSDNAEGCRIVGLLLDAGDEKSASLLEIGTHTNKGGNKDNPTVLHDVFARVGGPTETATADAMVTVKQKYVIIDNMWLWRADHTDSVSKGLGYDKAVVNDGLVVEGDYVTALGLAAEHTLRHNVHWAGDNGELYFQQTELPYDVKSDYDKPGLNVTGKNFKGRCIGVYSFFNREFSGSEDKPCVLTAIKTNDATVDIERAFTIFLDPDGTGEITYVLNTTGEVSNSENHDTPQWVRLEPSTI